MDVQDGRWKTGRLPVTMQAQQHPQTRGSSADLITTETLTARITPSSATGTVQFTDANTFLGGPVSLTDDTATTAITLPAGDHSLAAEFTPTNPADYGPSTSTLVLLKKPTRFARPSLAGLAAIPWSTAGLLWFTGNGQGRGRDIAA